MISPIRLWYPLMHRDLHDIWFLGSRWLARVFKGDFVTLVVDSQEPSGEWVNNLYHSCLKLRQVKIRFKNYVVICTYIPVIVMDMQY